MIELKEIFLPLCGIKGSRILSEKYRVSNYGRIFNLKSLEFCKLSLCGEPKYHYVTLSHKGVRGTYRVHRLVAMSFLPNPLDLPIVHHKDRNKLNNYIGNLEWVTRSHNQLESDRVDKGVISFLVKSCDKFVSTFNKRRQVYREYHRLQNIKENIIYRWRYEYITKVELSKRYDIPVFKIHEILKDVHKKEKKPKFKKVSVSKIYNKNCVREKYLDGEHSRKKLSEEFGVSTSTIDTWLLGLPTHRSKSLPIELREQIYNEYSLGLSFSECYRKYSISKDMMSSIIRKFRNKDK